MPGGATWYIDFANIEFFIKDWQMSQLRGAAIKLPIADSPFVAPVQ
jgi:hypothetical protein